MMKFSKEDCYALLLGALVTTIILINSHFQLKKLNGVAVGKVTSVYTITAGEYFDYKFIDYYGNEVIGSSSVMQNEISTNEFYIVLYERRYSERSHLLESHKLKDSLDINKYMDLEVQDLLSFKDKIRYSFTF